MFLIRIVWIRYKNYLIFFLISREKKSCIGWVVRIEWTKPTNSRWWLYFVIHQRIWKTNTVHIYTTHWTSMLIIIKTKCPMHENQLRNSTICSRFFLLFDSPLLLNRITCKIFCISTISRSSIFFELFRLINFFF